MPTGLEKQTAQRATDCGETPLYVSKVTAPRNPKLLRGPVEEQKVKKIILQLQINVFNILKGASEIMMCHEHVLNTTTHVGSEC